MKCSLVIFCCLLIFIASQTIPNGSNMETTHIYRTKLMPERQYCAVIKKAQIDNTLYDRLAWKQKNSYFL